VPSIANIIPAIEPPAAAAAPETTGPETAVLEAETSALRPVDAVDPKSAETVAATPGPITFVDASAPADDLPPLSIGALNDRLRVLSINAASLKALGFETLPAKGSAVLLAGRDWAGLKQALINHIEALA
jgi:hypothetical protein